MTETKKLWYKNNKQHMRKYNKEYRKNHKERMRLLKAKWMRVNKEKANAHSSKWQKAHPEKVKAKSARHRSMGYNELNESFKDSVGHHINSNDVIHMPAKYHIKYHNHYTGVGMERMNNIARRYL